MTDSAEAARPFTELGNYDWPALPAEESARRWFERLRSRLRPKDEGPLIAQENLQRAGADRLDQLVPTPPTGPLADDLALSLRDWWPGDAASVRVVVMPPGDPDDTVADWGRRNGATMPEPPERLRLLDSARLALPDLTASLIVIPRLEDWFLRHSDGMDLVERLLAAVDDAPGRVLIGCNSWAWRYLSAVAGADVTLPRPMIFQAFDDKRLAGWFRQLARLDDPAAREGQMVFRRVDTGGDVFLADEDEDRQSDYFRKLAARSLGIPWVAWHIWRQGLRTGRDIAEADDDEGRPEAVEKMRDADETTVWVSALDEGSLPARGGQDILLVLQALMIHGPLGAEALRHTLPLVGRSVAAPALLKAGMVTKDAQGRIAVAPEAYPTIRSGLRNSGFPMDKL